jgi:hypothetical protein
VLSGFFARLAISIAVLLIALVAAVTAVAFFAYALYLVLLNIVVPPAAAALTGLLILLFAIVLIQATRGRPRMRRKREGAPSPEAWENAAQVGGELGRKIRGLTEAHASGGLLAALLAGFAMGVSPKLRAFLQSLLKP